MRANLDSSAMETDTLVEDLSWFTAFVKYACKKNRPRDFEAVCAHAKLPTPSSVHTLSLAQAAIKSISGAECADDRSVRFSDDEGNEFLRPTGSEVESDEGPSSSQNDGATEVDVDAGGEGGYSDTCVVTGGEVIKTEAEDDEEHEESKEGQEEEEVSDEVLSNDAPTEKGEVADLPRLIKSRVRPLKSVRLWAKVVAAGIEADLAMKIDEFLAYKLRIATSLEDLRKAHTVPGSLPEMQIDMGFESYTVHGTIVLKRDAEDQLELDRAIAVETKFRVLQARRMPKSQKPRRLLLLTMFLWQPQRS